ncbi:hypothetical protein EHB58_24005 [Salmonella enterica subsp. enterica serovar Hull]|uniref:Uncharacterized protein n=1 Tax=Salmonella enterica subsp. enterica serovar Hull TaxID=1403564 RepID=A0A5X4PLR2_SALET|nr:hypothetical protein [Salmonella enterica subsp. enterica serovar Putten]EBZ7588772.1 hypothetical protein [Salmonella enterica subsp. enterica serovar Hull]EBZ8651198.1 hypothetical protein [Salmonella enterica subsp. enterica serovar Hull]EEB7450870.1 hypothetical protein [Salmonella enterica subsp. enterica serovar Emek]
MVDKQVDQTWLEALLSLFCQQRLLPPGKVTPTMFRVLAELGRMRNIRILNAMEAHLVKGWTREKVSSMYNVSSGYLSRQLADMNRVWQLTEILRMNMEHAPLASKNQGEKNDTSEI